jgi:exonuclease III
MTAGPDPHLPPAISGRCRHRHERLKTWRLGKSGRREAKCITLLQCNVDGLTESKLAELQAVADDEAKPVDVILVQENKLKKASPSPKLDGFDIIRRDRTQPRGKGEILRGGVAIFVRHGTKFASKTTPVSHQNHRQVHGVVCH